MPRQQEGPTHGAVLHDDALVRHEQTLERIDDSAQVCLVLVVLVQPLGVQHVVESRHARLQSTLSQGTGHLGLAGGPSTRPIWLPRLRNQGFRTARLCSESLRNGNILLSAGLL